MGAYAWVFDVTLLLIIGAVTWAVSSEGMFGAAVMFVNVVFAGLIAFSLFEPCASLIVANMGFMATFADFVSLMVLFCLAFTLIRVATDNLAPVYVRFHGLVDQGGRFVFGIATAWYLTGMLVCTVETAPVHKKFLGYQWQNHAFWGMGIDRFWLGFVQATTERYFDWQPARAFDSRSNFILRYHNFRPFGEPDENMPGFGKKPAAGQPAEGAPEGGAGGQPQGAGGQGGRPPLDPTGATRQPNL